MPLGPSLTSPSSSKRMRWFDERYDLEARKLKLAKQSDFLSANVVKHGLSPGDEEMAAATSRRRPPREGRDWLLARGNRSSSHPRGEICPQCSVLR